ncbi:MAG TPA: TIGR02265 family protein [Anaeromyxobacteraceae bacterium]|nr:TIGR02265 family protein [Anaeromyxobacteraceae bacterium]
MAEDGDQSARVKGALLGARLTFVRERGGEKALEQVLSSLPAPDREILKGWILPISWYPLELALRLDDAIARVLSPGDRRRIFLEMGRQSAQANLTGAQAPFVKAGDPHFFLANVPRMYATHHSRGRRTYERTGETSGVIRTFDAERVSRDDCLTVVGWLERALQLSGAAEPRVAEVQCRSAGAPHCEYRCEWR